MSKLFSRCGLMMAAAAVAITGGCAAPGGKATVDAITALPRTIEADGTIIVRSFRLPPSPYLTDKAKELLPREPFDVFDLMSRPDPELIALRNELPKQLAPRIAEFQRMYRVTTSTGEIAGVPAAWARPATGVAQDKSRKILLNLPGGGFVIGSARSLGMLESIPIAGILGVEIVSITYRQAPEAHHPAAIEDAVKVYKEILKTHKPKDVAIFGCSAGGFLTAQTTAALIREKLPLPAAIGLFCASADLRLIGDSAAFDRPFQGLGPRDYKGTYFAGSSVDDPAVSPIVAPEVLRQFPPTLLIESLRTLELSGALATHNALEKAGVPAQLHIWDGFGHAFFLDPAIPESHDVFEVMARFFGRHLRISL